MRREFERWLATGNAIALLTAITACAIIYFWPRPAPIFGPVPGGGDIPKIYQIDPPPEIVPRGTSQPDYTVVPDVDRGIIEPVDDVVAIDDPKLGTTLGGSGDGSEGDMGPIDGDYAGGIPRVDLEPPATETNEPYVPFDTPPQLVSINPPAYPEMVRNAGIDGTVLVRVFVGLNGRVKDAKVVEGIGALREAALASARTALFTPATQGTHPVEVWVVIPITFELSSRY
ncbi:MAG TPA: energy transducer TonB [Candidatus Krumholzibacteria bacterium]|nr:energy transducer TonB [Candidatus Krumholzibacteria bacterium]